MIGHRVAFGAAMAVLTVLFFAVPSARVTASGGLGLATVAAVLLGWVWDSLCARPVG